MKFDVNAKNLVTALDAVSSVRPTQPAGTEGYLFSVRGNMCNVYSRNAMHVARSSFPVSDSDGDVDFIYPVKAVDAFRYVSDTVSFTVTEESTGEDTTSIVVSYADPSGASATRSTVDPNLLAKCEEDLAEATASFEYPATILQIALNNAKNYCAKDDRVQEVYKVVQIFDASTPDVIEGNGVMFASNTAMAIFFKCSEFLNKALVVGSEHVSIVGSFLGKCPGKVKVHNGQNMLFFEDTAGNILGVLKRVKQHTKYKYIPLQNDQFVFQIPKSSILASLKYLRAELDANRDKISVQYKKDSGQIVFQMLDRSSKAKAMPVRIKVVLESPDFDDFAFNLNIDHFISLFDSAQSNDVEFRVFTRTVAGKSSAFFRSIDRFWVDESGKILVDITQSGAIECTVTRFVSSKD